VTASAPIVTRQRPPYRCLRVARSANRPRHRPPDDRGVCLRVAHSRARTACCERVAHQPTARRAPLPPQRASRTDELAAPGSVKRAHHAVQASAAYRRRHTLRSHRGALSRRITTDQDVRRRIICSHQASTALRSQPTRPCEIRTDSGNVPSVIFR